MKSSISHAIQFAGEAHKDQIRKYTNEPYLSHPIAVMGLVTSVIGNLDMIIAAILHDVVEDTDISIADIINNFGPDVSLMVNDLTDISKPSDGKRSRRKTIDRLHIAKASNKAKTIKLADIIDNIKTIQYFDPDFAKIYMNEKRMLLGVLKEGDSRLWNIANDIIENYYDRQKEK